MPTEPTPPPKARRAFPRVIDDGRGVQEVDGFANLTPEQRQWPVDRPFADDEPTTGGPQTAPSPPG